MSSPLLEDAFIESVLDTAKAALSNPNYPKPLFFTFETESNSTHEDEGEDIESRFLKPLPSKLPDQDDQQVSNLLKKTRTEIISTIAKEVVHGVDIRKLRPRKWLNDLLIDFYGAMIQARSDRDEALPKIHYFGTMFWKLLKRDGYEKGRLHKWTKKFDIFSKDALLIPVNHHNAHWTAASINFCQKRFESYDSLFEYNDQVIPLLREYVNEECLDKKKKPFDFTGWVDWVPEDSPRQENTFDCGVFTCHVIEALSRGEERFSFSQKDMPYLRRRMVWEIGNAQLRGGYYG